MSNPDLGMQNSGCGATEALIEAARAWLTSKRMRRNWSQRREILEDYLGSTRDISFDALSIGEREALELCEGWQSSGVHLIVRRRGAAFPKMLSDLYDCPPLLFGLGAPQLLFRRILAVVGSRSVDIPLARFTEQISRTLAEHRFVVVSGLAKGVDAAAHRGALGSGLEGSTIAVLGQGFGKIYPAENQLLAEEIVNFGGLLLSEYEPGTPALPQHFLARNRIIAALAESVVVVQAAERSGSLVTARHALDLGKSIMVVPGAVTDARFQGSHRLLRAGAELVASAGDVIDALGVEVPRTRTTGQLSADNWILRELKERGQLNLKTLFTLAPSESRTELDLLELELQGKVERLPGGMLQLKAAD